MAIKRGADAVVETLREHGTEIVIGYIGHSTHEIADAVGKSGLRTINPATELGGAYMVNAYNYVKGRPAAVGIWHTVGALLLHPALQEAKSSRIPAVHLGLNGESRLHGRDGALQQVPSETFRPVTRSTERVERIDKLGEAVHRAFRVAQGVPAGPAYVDIPFDLTVDLGEIPIPPAPVAPAAGPEPRDTDVREAAAQLVAAERPVIVVGGGAVRSDAGEEIRAIAELVGVPIVTSSTGQGLISEDHPLCMGPTGLWGWSSANATLADADFALVIGSRLSDWGVAQGYIARLPSKIVQVDTDPARLGEFYYPRLAIVADARAFAAKLLAALPETSGYVPAPFETREAVQEALKRKHAWRQWTDEVGADNSFPMKMWRVMRAVREQLGPDDFLVADIGGHSIPVMTGAIMRKPRRLLLSFGEGVLGSAFPMGIGAKLAEPSSKVVVAAGDGGFQYHFNELRVAVAEQLPIVVIVFNNGSYGANDWMMQSWYGKSQWSVFANPDWVALAKAYGADGERVERAEDIEAALQRGLASDRPYIIDVPLDPNEGFPENGSVGPAFLIKGREIPPDLIGGLAPGENLR
ncbi:MAG TPA: thiamine pyrophosphate-binding protein [Acidimicrobiia bacterium]|nr:thiamine pyrophosphate-binding protein [Acidimicrobiia bacterium]